MKREYFVEFRRRSSKACGEDAGPVGRGHLSQVLGSRVVPQHALPGPDRLQHEVTRAGKCLGSFARNSSVSSNTII